MSPLRTRETAPHGSTSGGGIHTGRLLIAPLDPSASPHRESVLRAVSEAGLIGRPLEGREQAFSIGPAFTDLLAFVGCAVAIRSDPGLDASFCHLRIPPATARPRAYFGRNTRPPRCPRCRGRYADWRATLDRVEPDGEWPSLTCPGCGEMGAPWSWDWKLQGGLSRLVIRIEEIFPGEAVPMPGLLGLLRDAADCPWHYFYQQD